MEESPIPLLWCPWYCVTPCYVVPGIVLPRCMVSPPCDGVTRCDGAIYVAECT